MRFIRQGSAILEKQLRVYEEGGDVLFAGEGFLLELARCQFPAQEVSWGSTGETS